MPLRREGLEPPMSHIRWVTSEVLCDRRLPNNFRYARLATEIARRCTMSRSAISRRFPMPAIIHRDQRDGSGLLGSS